MGNNVQGFEYEGKVIEALQEAGCCGDITEGAGASSVGADADFVVDGVRYLVEVKKDAGAQMGGTSVRYDVGGSFDVASSAVEDDTAEMIVAALEQKREHIDSLLKFICMPSFPLTCEKHLWEEAKTVGMLKPINAKIQKDTEFIVNHYKKKNIHYIQIGGAGLFYLGENPANLPVPKLEGQINIELRAGRSGSRKNLNGIPVVGGGLRAQGRLKFKGQSNFTLDDAESVKRLIAPHRLHHII